MSVDASATTRPSPALRVDLPESDDADRAEWRWSWPQRFAAFAAMATGFVLLGGACLDLGADESRLGLAAMETLGPFGQVFGGWEPSVWVGRLVPSLVWAWGEGGMPTSASVRWPSAIAGIVIGLVLARRCATTLGGRAGVLVGLCWFGCVGLIDRSAGAGVDLMVGLGTVAALDRLLGRGSDAVAGLCAAVAFLAGGWPPLALIVLTAVVLGRPAAVPSWRLLLPPAVAAAVWSSWSLRVAPVEAWAAALTLPLTEGPAWLLAPGVLALGLPWAPVAALWGSRSVRDGWAAPGRSLVTGWLQTTGVCLAAGTFIPGLAAAARVPALAGLAVAAAAGCDRLLSGTVTPAARRWFFAAAVTMTAAWAVLVVAAGGYLAAAVPYYRWTAVGLILVAVPAALLAVWSACRRETRGAFFALFALAVLFKAAHWGYYAPEWNYRLSQGPWGRAVGQWVPPRWPVYTTHAWRHDFAFATGHPFRQLASPQHLAYQPGEARYVLLLGPEFENWPASAPRLTKVTEFRDEYDTRRVLARTDGPLPWTRTAGPRAAE